MRSNPQLSLKMVILAGCLVSLGSLIALGCNGEDSAPTNTKNSQYIDTGQTAADKVGAMRAKSRLPHGGQAPN